MTAVGADDVLLSGTGSTVLASTWATLVRLPLTVGAVTTTVITGAFVPLVSVARVQVTETLPLCEQLHPSPVALTNPTPVGSESTTLIPAAASGPALWTE